MLGQVLHSAILVWCVKFELSSSSRFFSFFLSPSCNFFRFSIHPSFFLRPPRTTAPHPISRYYHRRNSHPETCMLFSSRSSLLSSVASIHSVLASTCPVVPSPALPAARLRKEPRTTCIKMSVNISYVGTKSTYGDINYDTYPSCNNQMIQRCNFQRHSPPSRSLQSFLYYVVIRLGGRQRLVRRSEIGDGREVDMGCFHISNEVGKVNCMLLKYVHS